MDFERPITKILFIDNDEASFQFRKCMAKVMGTLPPIELFHANDATEALGLLEALNPDVIVIDGELIEEKDLFLDSLTSNHPPVVIQTEKKGSSNYDELITCVEKNESIDGIHQTLLLATEIGIKAMGNKSSDVLH